MSQKLHPDLKPLSANLKRLDISKYLIEKEFIYILEENDFDEIWMSQELYYKNFKNNSTIWADEYIHIFIACINEIYIEFAHNKSQESINDFNDFIYLSINYLIQNSEGKDFISILRILSELPIIKDNVIRVLEGKLKNKDKLTVAKSKNEFAIEIDNFDKTKKYQIFISSTFTDLIEERQASVQAILKKGHIPAGMELFTAGDKSQWEIIERWIDESDIYLLILGGRYGTINKHSKISYTEMEYNYAVKNNKPVFSLVLADNIINKKPIEIIKDYDLKNPKYISFKNNVTSKMCSFPENIDQIKAEIIHSLDNIISEHRNQMKGWIKGN